MWERYNNFYIFAGNMGKTTGLLSSFSQRKKTGSGVDEQSKIKDISLVRRRKEIGECAACYGSELYSNIHPIHYNTVISAYTQLIQPAKIHPPDSNPLTTPHGAMSCQEQGRERRGRRGQGTAADRQRSYDAFNLPTY